MEQQVGADDASNEFSNKGNRSFMEDVYQGNEEMKYQMEASFLFEQHNSSNHVSHSYQEQESSFETYSQNWHDNASYGYESQPLFHDQYQPPHQPYDLPYQHQPHNQPFDPPYKIPIKNQPPFQYPDSPYNFQTLDQHFEPLDQPSEPLNQPQPQTYYPNQPLSTLEPTQLPYQYPTHELYTPYPIPELDSHSPYQYPIDPPTSEVLLHDIMKMIMDQGTILSEFQRDIEEIKIAALKCEKAIEEENSQKQLTPLIVEKIPVREPVKEICCQNTIMEELLDNDLLYALGDVPQLNDTFNCADCDGVTLCIVCAEIEACLKGDDVQVTNIFNGSIDIYDEVKNVSDIGWLEKNNYEVEDNVLVEVDKLKNMKSSKFSVDLNENFDSFMVCVDSVVRDCALLPIDKKYEKEEIIVDYGHPITNIYHSITISITT
ncbi:hypothetical protein PIB30_044002 [Stylosanthes scabra]|uniref:Uncharacterized protein n=1 Tax=Stylosanthes scabra TaxID=79078 RepID=A0ABU6VE42_9FABA|nr:hypothetical protein [Stylosanthes scabra]